MTDFLSLARSKATAVWGVLIAATLVSWWMGVHGVSALDDAPGAAGSVIVLIALVKVRFVGLYFMDLRAAPAALRVAFEVHCLVLCLLLMGMLLLA